MNKKQLIAHVAKKTGVSRKETELICETILSTITETLCTEGKVQFVGFGAFETKGRVGHSGLNPRTKEAIHIPEHKAPVFKASKQLKDIINK
ncbi:MAG: HU family DNA-binding protein [Oscillospiraceae bacterium]